MRRNCARIAALLLGSQVLAGCSYLTGDDGYFRDRQGDYLTAPVVPDMRVPDNLDSYTLDQLYVVPEEVAPNREVLSGAIPRPKPLDTNRPEGVVIRRYSGENWIVIAATPGQVWPRVRDFWTQRGTMLDYENPVDGVMETVWISALGSAEDREKFRLRIEPGIHTSSSEISLIQISRPDSVVGSELVVWPALSESEDREFALLQDLSQYLADRTDIYSSSSSSLLAGSLAGETKASLIEDRGFGPVLELRVSMNRAWGQVGQALSDAGLNVLERDRDNNVFRVEFAGLQDPQERGGFLSRMFGDDDEAAAAASEYEVRLEQAPNLIAITAVPAGGGTPTGLETDLIRAILTNL